MSKKLAFVWDFSVEPLQLYGWADGLSMALRILAEKYDYTVKVFASDDPNVIYQDIENFMPDQILCWGSLDRPSFAGIRQFNKPTALCFAGGPTRNPQSISFDLIFVENDMYVKEFEQQDINVMKAFGTNDHLFKPMALPKKWDTIYTATFARWKRHNIYAEAIKDKGLAVGKIQPHEMDCYEVCVDNGLTVMPEVPYHVMPFLYNQSKVSVVTALWGGQRNILESMTCNMPVIVMSDAKTNTEIVEEAQYGIIADPNVESLKEAINKALTDKHPDGQKIVQAKYSAELYADRLHQGLSSI